MKKRTAFTFIELIFVIVVIGIIAKFGVEFMAQAYRNYIYQHISNKLQNSSSIAVDFIANRLQYRIKDSVIIRDSAGNFRALEGENNASGYDILEWISYDIAGFRGRANGVPFWSGIIDKEYAHATPIPSDIYSSGSDTSAVDTYIQVLSYGDTTIDDAALYIMSSDSDVLSDYGWDGVAITDQSHAMHPVNDDANVSKFVTPVGNTETFAALNDALEDARYKLSWTAYAIVYDPGTDFDGTLTLFYDYQPWNGESYTDGKSAVIMEHVSAFRKRQSFHVMKIQVCTKSELSKASNIDEDRYSVCKEKTIY